jgi:hypothetical protein
MYFMRMIRTSIAAIAAAIALAACGGHGIVPSQSAGMGTSFAPDMITAKKTSPCDVSGLWYFEGACTVAKITSKGGSVKLAAYMGITFDSALGTNNAKGKVEFKFSDAVDKNDITGGQGTFPAYPTVCLSGYECDGTPLVYLSALNTSTKAVVFSGPSVLTITAKKFPHPTCFPGLLEKKKGKLGWVPETIVGAKPKGDKLVLEIPGSTGFMFPPGPLYIVIACAKSS